MLSPLSSRQLRVRELTPPSQLREQLPHLLQLDQLPMGLLGVAEAVWAGVA